MDSELRFTVPLGDGRLLVTASTEHVMLQHQTLTGDPIATVSLETSVFLQIAEKILDEFQR